jgi:hypothetical protein
VAVVAIDVMDVSEPLLATSDSSSSGGTKVRFYLVLYNRYSALPLQPPQTVAVVVAQRSDFYLVLYNRYSALPLQPLQTVAVVVIIQDKI